MLLNIGSWGMCLIIWFVSGLLALAGGLCWSELSTIFPKQGGQYIFIKEVLGDMLGFLYIFTSVLLLNPSGTAVITIASSKYLLEPLSPCVPTVSIQCMSICIIMLLTFVHCYSTQVTSH